MRPTRDELEKIAPDDALDEYAEIFDADRKLLSITRRCPECSEPILACDNGWLDAKPIAGPYSEHIPGACGVLKLGPFYMLASGDLDGGSQHRLHEHQPEEDK
jgi:hypothetical protein